MSTELLECGHPESPHSDFTRGYGTNDKGERHCYACCAANDRAAMIETGRATLYLVSRPNAAPATVGSGMRARAPVHWFVMNWPGSLEFNCFPTVRKSSRGGGFGSQRTDAWFAGPDGYIWHAVNRGDSQIARCRRTKERTK